MDDVGVVVVGALVHVESPGVGAFGGMEVGGATEVEGATPKFTGGPNIAFVLVCGVCEGVMLVVV